MTTYNTGNAIGSTDARDLLDNAQALDEAINSTSQTYTDRRGVQRRTLPSLQAEFPNASANAAAAAASATQAANEATSAAAAVDAAFAEATAAQASRVAAETARDAAQLSAGVYATTAAGLAATASGEYFSVPSADSSEYLILYFNNAGAAVEQKRYPSASVVQSLAERLVTEFTVDYAWTVRDPAGRAAIGVKNDGSVAVSDLSLTSLNGRSANDIDAALDASSLTSTITAPGIAYSINDSLGRAAFVVRDDGSVAVSDLVLQKINGIDADIIGNKTEYAGSYLAEIVYFNNTGQSLGEGSNGVLTATQEYDNIGFPARSVSPTSTVPLTVANAEVAGLGECPMYGALGHIKELILEENRISYAAQSFQLLACNNAYSGISIDGLKKGTTPYSNVLSQVSSGLSIAQAAGKTFMGGAIFWTQGENNITMPLVTYRDTFKQLALDYDTDIRAITGQSHKVPLITYQLTSMNE